MADVKLEEFFKRMRTKEAWFQMIDYEPHDKQLLYHNSKARFRMANCGRRFGKTTMAARDLEPKLLIPNSLYWIIGNTYKLGEKEFRVIWQDVMVKLGLGKDKRIKRAYNKEQGDMRIEFPWNSKIYVMSADHQDNLVGDGLNGVIMSEAAKHNEDTWKKYVRPALADNRGFADFPTTPESFNWYYELWMLGQDANERDYESWKFPTWFNVKSFPGGVSDPEILEMRKNLGKVTFQQEVEAEFGAFSGKIYEEWDLTKHVKNIKYNPDWPNYIAFDWGFTNPLAAVEFQVSPNDEIYVWRVHYLAKQTVYNHCQIMKKRDQPKGYKITLCFGDSADPEAAQTVSEELAYCITDGDAKSNWREGIDLVKSFLEREVDQDEFGGPIYKPAFFVDPSCVDIINEFNGYRAQQNARGLNATEGPVKKNDHALDAIRYGLVHIFILGAGHHLSEAMNNVTKSKVQEEFEPHFKVNELGALVGVGSDSSASGIITMGGEF